jgi:hypothetical protein
MPQPRRLFFARCSPLIAVVAVVLSGCGSTDPTASSSSAKEPLPGVTPAEEAHSAPSATTASTSAAEPNTGGPASFIVQATTQEGDRVKVEGWFGPPLPASESDVDQSVLSECPPPANEGRSMVVRLDLTTTLESSLSGAVGLETSYIPETEGRKQLPSFVMGYSQGASCVRGEPGATSINLGTLQPGQSTDFTMWVVLPSAITPEDPHPSEKTLGAERWVMAVPQPTVNGSGYNQDEHSSVTGPRVRHCPTGGAQGEPETDYIAVVGDTPTTVFQTGCPTP